MSLLAVVQPPLLIICTSSQIELNFLYIFPIFAKNCLPSLEQRSSLFELPTPGGGRLKSKHRWEPIMHNRGPHTFSQWFNIWLQTSEYFMPHVKTLPEAQRTQGIESITQIIQTAEACWFFSRHCWPGLLSLTSFLLLSIFTKLKK